MFTEEVLQEIVSNWKLDSKQEEISRYFYHTSLVEELSMGHKFYVIGRKGTGKTAISEYLQSPEYLNHLESQEPGVSVFTDKLTFKNFPFNELYDLKDSAFRTNQYITIWKFVIYSSICKMMTKSNNLPPLIQSELEKIFKSKPVGNAFKKDLRKWLSANFKIGIFGFGANSSKDSNDISWIEKVTILEDFILENYHASDKFIIMFDELDEDYREINTEENYRQYSDLLTGLFKAIQDIRSSFKEYKIYPIIFLRDDIYDLLQDADKSKWADFLEELNWDTNSIKKLLEFRFNRAIDPNIQRRDMEKFTVLWSNFATQSIPMGTRAGKRMESFKFIEKKTLIRPRDFIKYIQECSKLALNNPGSTKISVRIIKQANHAFSNHLKNELIDEISSIIPDIKDILEIFRELRKQTFPLEEFKSIFDYKVSNNIIKSDFNFVINTLFYFSVIGNQPNQQTYQSFKFQNRDASLNVKENIVVHQGLFRALQIL